MESVTPVVFRVGVDQPSLACFPPLVVSKRRPHPTTKQAGEGRAPSPAAASCLNCWSSPARASEREKRDCSAWMMYLLLDGVLASSTSVQSDVTYRPLLPAVPFVGPSCTLLASPHPMYPPTGGPLLRNDWANTVDTDLVAPPEQKCVPASSDPSYPAITASSQRPLEESSLLLFFLQPSTRPRLSPLLLPTSQPVLSEPLQPTCLPCK